MDRVSIETSLPRSFPEDRMTQQHQHRRREPRAAGDFCPTPEEIAAECRKIQSEWSERERWRRAGYVEGRPVWEVPTYAVASMSAP